MTNNESEWAKTYNYISWLYRVITPLLLGLVLFTNNQEYASYGLKGIYKISQKISLNGGFGGAFFHKNLAKSPAISFGIAIEN